MTTRRGTILIVTMWIILVLAGLTLMLAHSMRVEAVCSANELSALQADAVQQGAIQYVLNRVASLDGKLPDDANMPSEAVTVGDGAFWILKGNFENDKSYAFGLTDEAAKINLNTASQTVLAKLPDITDELAASIIDWRDLDSNITPGGAESEYYLLQSDPHQCKNAALETVEELMLIKGATTQILFGEDTNRNGYLDDNENDANLSDPPDDRNGQLDRGLLPFVTVYSQDKNLTADGKQRIHINNAPNGQISSLLQNAKVSTSKILTIIERLRSERPYLNVMDFYTKSGLTLDEFKAIADLITTTSQSTVRGLVNVNTAPRQVLACLPELDDSDAASLINKRSQGGDDLNTIAWVAGVLTPAKARAVGGMITTRSSCYSADIVSISGDGRAFKRCRIVVDASASVPKIIYRQDLTHLGWPLDPAIQSSLRAGRSVNDLPTGQTVRQEVR